MGILSTLWNQSTDRWRFRSAPCNVLDQSEVLMDAFRDHAKPVGLCGSVDRDSEVRSWLLWGLSIFLPSSAIERL